MALAGRTGLSRAAIGATVVAVGTSVPELVVSLGAARKGLPELAVGNVVGSNIYNIGLILGLAALFVPLTSDASTRRTDAPIMLGAAVALAVLGMDGELSRWEGALLAVSYLGYVWVQLRRSTPDPPGDEPPLSLAAAIPMIVLGLPLLAFSADLCIDGATQLAEMAGVSRRVIGLTIVAIGTSLPELTASLIAAARGEGDLAIANVVGSNIFNVLGICGITSMVLPLELGPTMLAQDLPVMMGFCALFLALVFRGTLHRVEGTVLLALAAAYTTVLLLS